MAPYNRSARKNISFEMDEERCPVCCISADVGRTICCNNCNNWYHFSCCGVSENELCVIYEDIPYICRKCSKSRTKSVALKAPRTRNVKDKHKASKSSDRTSLHNLQLLAEKILHEASRPFLAPLVEELRKKSQQFKINQTFERVTSFIQVPYQEEHNWCETKIDWIAPNVGEKALSLTQSNNNCSVKKGRILKLEKRSFTKKLSVSHSYNTRSNLKIETSSYHKVAFESCTKNITVELNTVSSCVRTPHQIRAIRVEPKINCEEICDLYYPPCIGRRTNQTSIPVPSWRIIEEYNDYTDSNSPPSPHAFGTVEKKSNKLLNSSVEEINNKIIYLKYNGDTTLGSLQSYEEFENRMKHKLPLNSFDEYNCVTRDAMVANIEQCTSNNNSRETTSGNSVEESNIVGGVENVNGDNESVVSAVRHRSIVSSYASSRLSPKYNHGEEKAILDFIVKNRRYSEVNGNSLWIVMEEKNIVANRSWQSMKERYRKYIAPKLENFSNLNSKDIRQLTKYLSTVSKNIKNKTK